MFWNPYNNLIPPYLSSFMIYLMMFWNLYKILTPSYFYGLCKLYVKSWYLPLTLYKDFLKLKSPGGYLQAKRQFCLPNRLYLPNEQPWVGENDKFWHLPFRGRSEMPGQRIVGNRH